MTCVRCGAVIARTMGDPPFAWAGDWPICRGCLLAIPDDEFEAERRRLEGR